MKDELVVISLSGQPMKVNGTGPLLCPIDDEADSIIRQYGRAAVLKMFNDAKPKL